MKYKIAVDKTKCIGCGACTNMCDNFKLVGDKASPVKAIVTEVGCNNDAKDICPVEAISVVETK